MSVAIAAKAAASAAVHLSPADLVSPAALQIPRSSLYCSAHPLHLVLSCVCGGGSTRARWEEISRRCLSAAKVSASSPPSARCLHAIIEIAVVGRTHFSTLHHYRHYDVAVVVEVVVKIVKLQQIRLQ